LTTHRLSKHKTTLVILFSLLFVAAALRFYRLNEGLWLDEIITDVNYAHLSFLTNITTFDSENQHFLYSLLAHLSFLVFGESNWALRLPAVLFGIASLAALFLLGRELSNDAEALLAVALLTFSYHHVWFSQNARGYTGLLFWTILSSWLFLRGLKDHRRRTWLFFAISGALGVYTHLTMLFVIIDYFLIYLFIMLFRRPNHEPGSWTDLWIGFGVTGLLCLILFAPVIPQILATIGGSEQSVVTAWKNPLWTVLEIVKGLELGFLGDSIVILAMAVFLVGVSSYAGSQPVLLGLFIIPSAIGAGTTIAIGHHLWPRFFFFGIGFAALILVRGVMQISQLITRLWLKLRTKQKSLQVSQGNFMLGIVLCFTLIIASSLSVPRAYGPKQDYLGAYNFITNNQLPGDEVVTVSLTTFIYQNYYPTNWIEVSSSDGLNAIRREAKRTWLIYTFPSVLASTHPDIMKSIQADFGLVKQFGSTVDEGDIYIYRVDNAIQ
jgi:mannosyltransferase